eukprot:TRINITY_DN19265_c0_g1_i1.p1 TRINITY_DN19265_c0_g1~~TRINITY_DN19265_c0_g1_i1.p1  ORF type:complete len:1822 (+),score=413.99 TRINITY_DN19265_c0_g1_i1:430-5466(+)
MTALWDSPIGTASADAAACAFALLQKAGHYDFEIPTDVGDAGPLKCEFAVHIGGSCGTVTCMVVGGGATNKHGRWRSVVMGRPVERAGFAANIAKDGELGVTSEMVEALEASGLSLVTRPPHTECPDVVLADAFSGAGHKASPPEETKIAAPEQELRKACALFSFDTLLHSLAGNRLGELRNVSTVFIKVALAADEQGEGLHGRLNGAVQTIQKHLTAVDGILNKIALDDKGLICLCLLGIPHHSHADDTGRSVTFALRVGRKLARSDFHTSIGICRARVFCGVTGDSWRQEYTVLGDGVNVAARLMQHAAIFAQEKFRSVMCDTETARSVDAGRHGAALFGGKEILLKGRSTPIACFHVVAHSDKRVFKRRAAELDGIELVESDSDDSSAMQSDHSSRSSIASFASNSSFTSYRGGSSMSATLVSSSLGPSNPSLGQMQSAGRNRSTGKQAGPRGRGGVRQKQDSPRTHTPHTPRTPRTPHGEQEGPPSPSRTPPRATGSGGDIGELLEDCLQIEDATSPDASAGDLQPRDFRAESPEQMIGRADELAALTDFLVAAVPQGAPLSDRVLHVTGDVQSGKTMFLLHAAFRVKSKGWNLICVEGLEAKVQQGFSALHGPVSHAITPDTPPTLTALHYFARPKHIPLPPEDATVDEKIAAANDAAYRLLSSGMPGKRTVLLVDDVQWVDGLTLSFIHYALSQGARAVVTHRRGSSAVLSTQLLDAPGTPASGGSSDSGTKHLDPIAINTPAAQHGKECVKVFGKARRAKLAPLDVQALRLVLTRTLRATDIHPSVLELVHRKSQGNCGFAVQMAAALKNGKQLVELPNGSVELPLSADDVRVGDLLAHSVPFIEAAVMNVVDRLEREHRSVLSLASVVGNVFSAGGLVRCAPTGQDTSVLHTALSGLVLLGVIIGTHDADSDAGGVFCTEYPAPMGQTSVGSGLSKEAAKEIFSNFDADGGGTVDPQELASALAALGFGSQNEQDIERIVGIIDANGDGEIDFDEFSAVMLTSHYTFVCPLARDIIYYTVLGRERRNLHSRVMDAFSREPRGSAELLVHHMRRGTSEGQKPAKMQELLTAAYRQQVTGGRFLLALRSIIALLTSVNSDHVPKSPPVSPSTASIDALSDSMCAPPARLVPAADGFSSEWFELLLDAANVLFALGRLSEAKEYASCVSARLPHVKRKRKSSRKAGGGGLPCCCGGGGSSADDPASPDEEQPEPDTVAARASVLLAEIAVWQGRALEAAGAAATAVEAASAARMPADLLATLGFFVGISPYGAPVDPTESRQHTERAARVLGPKLGPSPGRPPGLKEDALATALGRPAGALVLLAHPEACKLAFLRQAVPSKTATPVHLDPDRPLQHHERSERDYAVDKPPVAATRPPSLHALLGGLCVMRLLGGEPAAAEGYRRNLLASALAVGDMRSALHAAGIAHISRFVYEPPEAGDDESSSPDHNVWGYGCDMAENVKSYPDCLDAPLRCLMRAASALDAALNAYSLKASSGVFGLTDDEGFFAAEAEKYVTAALKECGVVTPMHCLALAALTHSLVGPTAVIPVDLQKNVSLVLRRAAAVYPFAEPAADLCEALVTMAQNDQDAARGRLRAAAAATTFGVRGPYGIRAQCHLCALAEAQDPYLAELRKQIPTGGLRVDRAGVAADLCSLLQQERIAAPNELEELQQL